MQADLSELFFNVPESGEVELTLGPVSVRVCETVGEFPRFVELLLARLRAIQDELHENYELGDTGEPELANDELKAALLAETVRVQQLECEIERCLGMIPAGFQISVREGGGSEDLSASLAASISRLVIGRMATKITDR